MKSRIAQENPKEQRVTIIVPDQSIEIAIAVGEGRGGDVARITQAKGICLQAAE